jgi:hypothetical protein
MPDEHLYWDNFPANRVPKSKVNIENQNMSVPPDSEVSGDPTEITMGPKKVFKDGYPTGKTVGVEGSTKGDKMPSISPIVASKNVEVLRTHGVTNDSGVVRVLHPEGMSVVASIASQRALIMTDDCKVVDIAAHQWPINLDTAVDVRAKLNSLVKYGDEIGIVAGTSGDFVMLKTMAGDLMVSIHDLEPVTADSGNYENFKAALDDLVQNYPQFALERFGPMLTAEQRDMAERMVGGPHEERPVADLNMEAHVWLPFCPKCQGQMAYTEDGQVQCKECGHKCDPKECTGQEQAGYEKMQHKEQE